MSCQSIKYFFIFAFVFFGFLSRGMADCNSLNITTAVTANLNMNVNNGLAQTITVTKSGGSGCNFFIVLSDGNGATGFADRKLDTAGSNFYLIQFYKDAGRTSIIKNYGVASNNSDVIFGSFGSGNPPPLVISFYPFVDITKANPAGPYTGQQFQFTIYKGDIAAKGSAVSSGSATPNSYKYTRSDSVEISLVDRYANFQQSDSYQSLNFGILPNNVPQIFDVMLKYSAGYVLSMKSKNNKRIKSGAEYISYSIKLDDTEVPLSDLLQIVKIVASGASIAGGERHPVAVQITGSIVGLQPGTYTDTVTFVISSVQ